MRGRGRYAGGAADRLDLPGILTVDRVAYGTGNIDAGVQWLGTVRGRFGWLLTPAVMAYATGGLAYGGVSSNAIHYATATANVTTFGVPFSSGSATAFPGVGHFSDRRIGWTAGGGLEWMAWGNMSLKVEGLYYDLGSASYQSSPITYLSPVPLFGVGQPLASNVATTSVRFNGIVGRAGLNYHFHGLP